MQAGQKHPPMARHPNGERQPLPPAKNGGLSQCLHPGQERHAATRLVPVFPRGPERPSPSLSLDRGRGRRVPGGDPVGVRRQRGHHWHLLRRRQGQHPRVRFQRPRWHRGLDQRRPRNQPRPQKLCHLPLRLRRGPQRPLLLLR
jgi:hypothetical protein